ncbi:cytosolic prostaglandin E synthase [Megalopta genalis]|uniref:cytosolic prostaglandin E synthase n=1 Tax=Megalopta genalis TaxID=115081 RepID=UPI003FD641EE
MTQEGQLPPPPVMWAQRNDILYVTICLEDCKDHIIEIEPEKIYFKGVGGTEQKMHELTIDLYGEIVPRRTIKYLKGRTFELVLSKKQGGPYWPRLTAEKTKAHWLKSDFNKWKDEDDSENENGIGMENNNLEEMMRQMGGLGGSGGSGSSKPHFETFEDMGDEGNEIDSDDDDLPDLIE